MNIEIKTKRYFDCPNCGKKQFEIEHLFQYKMNSAGPWFCDDCHQGWIIKISNNEVDIEKYKPTDPNYDGKLHYSTVYLRILPQKFPVIIKTKFSRREKEINLFDYNNLISFHYQENTHPINILHSADKIFLEGCDEDDALFQLVEVVDVKDDEDDL